MKPEKQILEVWQRGPVENVPALLQPVAHALLQAREELADIMNDFPEELLWQRPAEVASPAFHLQHLPVYWTGYLLMPVAKDYQQHSLKNCRRKIVHFLRR